MGGRSCDHNGSGAKAPKGIEEGVGLQAINPEIHSRRGRSSQGPDPPALSDRRETHVMAASKVDSHDCHV